MTGTCIRCADNPVEFPDRGLCALCQADSDIEAGDAEASPVFGDFNDADFENQMEEWLPEARPTYARAVEVDSSPEEE